MAQVNDLLVLGKANFLNEISSSQLLRAFGGIALNESTEQSTSLEYVLGIKAFASGGNILWSSVSNFANVIRLNASGNWGINISGTAAKATADASGNTITSTYAKIKTWNDMIHSSNEYTFASPAYSGAIWLNYRTASGTTDGNITTYNFGNGKGGTTGVTLVATTFNGNATSANYATSAGSASVASKISDITTTDQASSTATKRRIWFCYDNNVTGRPAYDDRFTIQTSTGTLFAPIFSGTLSGAIKDYNDGKLVKFGYSTSGVAQASATWLAVWDASVSGEYRLRAVQQSALKVAYANSAGSASTATSATYLTGQGANVANTRTQAYSQAVVAGGWASDSAGYGTTYGTTLDVSGYSTWYHRLAFHTNGQIDYWQGINTNTLSKIGTLLTTANYASILDGRYFTESESNARFVYVSGDTMTGKLKLGNSAQSGMTNAVGIHVHDLRNATLMPDTFGDQSVNFIFHNSLGDSTWRSAIHVKGWTGSYAAWQLSGNSHTSVSNKLYYREGVGSSWGSWLSISFENRGNTFTALNKFTGNVEISNLLTVATGTSHYGIKIGSTYLNAIDDQVIFQNNNGIRFGTDQWDWSCWAGLKYVHSSKTIYLGTADGTVFNHNSGAITGSTLALPGVRYLSINGKIAIDANDSWLRINESKAYSSGIYMGSNVVRTDGEFQVSSNGAAFYAKSNGTGYFDNDLKVKGHIFAYNYGRDGNNAPAFVYDKNGSNYTGIGSINVTDTIYFGAVNSTDFTWVTSYQQKWRFNGEVQALGANAFRLVYGNYGIMLRNDGSEFYFLSTASGDQYGTWNSVRPFYFNIASGRVTMVTGASVGGYSNTSYTLSTASFICNSWVRTVGATGWYNETYGGGMYMTDTTYVRVYNGKMLYSSGRMLADLTPSSWIDGQRYNNGGYNINTYSNADSYNPWMRATNNHANVAKWFSFGTLGKQFYWIGSATSRTSNGYDKGMTFNVESGLLYAPITGGDRVYSGYDSGQTGSVSCSNWFRSSGDTGWYNASHGCHVMPNIYSSYGSVCIRGGAKGGYEGLHFGSGTSGMTVMSIDGSHQGLYNQSTTGWIIYNNASNGLIAIGGSSVNSGYKVTLSGNTYNAGTLHMANNNITGVNNLEIADPGPGEGISWAGGNGWKIYESPNDLSNTAGNLQFVQNSTRRFTIDTSGNAELCGRMDVGCLLLTNTSWTGYGTADPSGNLTAVKGRVYFKLI